MRIGHASGGDPTGTPGDQTGREVCVRDWYGGSWDLVLRAKDPMAAEEMAAFCEQCCANPNVGYSQAARNTLRAAARAAEWGGADIATPCNCDCASFMSVCAEAAGVDMDCAYTWGNAPWTGNMRAQFLKTGAFEAISPVPEAAYLRRGDVLVDEDRHTVMVLDDGSLSHAASGATAPSEREPRTGASPSPAAAAAPSPAGGGKGDEGAAVPYQAGDTVIYKAGDGIYFRPDNSMGAVYCEVGSDEHRATVVAVKAGAARPLLVLLEGTDVCGWVSLESVEASPSPGAAAPPSGPSGTPAPTGGGKGQTVHVVVSGDTMWGISAKYGVSMQRIAEANGMKSIWDIIHPGDRLAIPNA